MTRVAVCIAKILIVVLLLLVLLLVILLWFRFAFTSTLTTDYYYLYYQSIPERAAHSRQRASGKWSSEPPPLLQEVGRSEVVAEEVARAKMTTV